MSDEIRWTLNPADPANFTGDVRTVLLAGAADGAAVKLFYVRFAPGARTHWHAHSGQQTLLVTEGRCRLQRGNRPAIELGAGESITIPPGERHWHGAAPDSAAAHIAINLDNRETTWLEPVTDDEYVSGD